MANIDSGASTAGLANVDAGFNLKVTGPGGDRTSTSPRINTGYAAMAARMDEGTKTGYPLVREAVVSNAGTQQVGNLISMYADNFNVTSGVNPTNYSLRSSTLTATTASGYLTMNAGSGINTSSSIAVQTYRTFELFGARETVMEMVGYRTTAPQANEAMEFGLFTCSTVSALLPTDGVFFRYNAAAELRGVISFAGTETQTGVMTSPTSSARHVWRIEVDDGGVHWWVDGVLQAIADLQQVAPTQATVIQAMAVPFTARYYIASTGPAVATQLRISDVNIYSPDRAPTKEWNHTLAGMGKHAYQHQNGQGVYGTIAQYANSVNPAVGVPTNTAAAAGTGLGGIFNVSTTPAASTDVIISSYQNPVGGVNQQPRTLYIQGVSIDTASIVPSSSGVMNLAWSLAFGHTGVSLASAMSAALGSTSPNRIALGAQQCASTAVPGALSNTITRQFLTPIPVFPGQFIQTVWRNNAVASTFGQLQHLITFDGYFE